MAENYQVFLSYSSKDKDFVHKLAEDLKSYGTTVWWDKWEMKVGDSLNHKIQDGLEDSAYLAVVLTPDSVASPWVERELNAVLVRELEHRNVSVLPLLVRDCTLPPFLKDKVYADFRTSYREGLQTLLERLAPRLDSRIVERLLSEDPSRVLGAFTRIPDPQQRAYVDVVISKLELGSSAEKMSALFCLHVLRHEQLRPWLRRLLHDSSQAVRRQVVFVMGELRSKEFEREVVGLLSDGNPNVRIAARAAVAKITGRRRAP